MTKTERVRYEMLLRVRDFGTSQAAAFPESSTGEQVFAKVAQAVAEIDAHARGKLLAAQEGRRAKAAARATVRRWMLAIARTARDVARGTPGLEKTLAMPRSHSDVALVTSAHTFLDTADSIKDQLVRLGLPVNFLAEFREAVNTFENAMAGRCAGRGSVAAGQAGIEAALVEGMNAARTLDVVVTNTLGHDPVLFARWQRDRRLVEGKSKGTGDATTLPVSPEADVPKPSEGERVHALAQTTHQALDKAS